MDLVMRYWFEIGMGISFFPPLSPNQKKLVAIVFVFLFFSFPTSQCPYWSTLVFFIVRRSARDTTQAKYSFVPVGCLPPFLCTYNNYNITTIYYTFYALPRKGGNRNPMAQTQKITFCAVLFGKACDIYFSSVMHFIIQLLLLPIGFLLWIRNREWNTRF